jgi:acetyltransferase-like isoleucine patch superfamily enzyme
MDREKLFKNHRLEFFFKELNEIHEKLRYEFGDKYNRSLPFNEELFDRWKKAEKLNFGEGSSIYDSSFVFGKPKVGKNVWIGPFTIIDGSGELIIGDNVTISTGSQIYTHDNIKQTLLGNSFEIEKKKVKIGRNTYIGPNVVISKGVSIGKHSVVATNSFVNKSFTEYSIIAGTPAKKIGNVYIKDKNIEFKYYNEK